MSPDDDESNPHSLNKYGGLSSSQSLLAVECSFVSSSPLFALWRGSGTAAAAAV